ncbi:MAG TPA: LamG-like jellyroll fold domain-containing protein [Tepidisphaeraceae bacterium]|jgi:hypothetical protein|nr:LamG-like jellyroll fold domain-containing protein [Tepidisphaeraceae bacterium]
MRCVRLPALASLILLLITESASASAFVRGAWYRLGDDDPGASVADIGIDPTRDSFSEHRDLSRFFSPHYAADVPPLGPQPNKFSMAFANQSLGGPGIPGFYGRFSALGMFEQGYALETWVKSASLFVGPGSTDNQLIAYNGDPPNNSGFGFFREGANYVARVGIFERLLGPAGELEWHHLAYIQSLGASSYYYDGKLIAQNTTDPIPNPATGGFWIGGRNTGSADVELFNGWIDEVRYQSFNPLAAGAFDPTNFLITVPEPTTTALLILAIIPFSFRRFSLP